MKQYNGKIAWITGATSGIGEQLVKLLNSYQCKTIICARRGNELERVKNECKFPELVFTLELDLSQPEKIKEIVDSQMEEQGHGTIDYLFNNAGVSQRSLAMDTSLETERKIMDINFFGNIALSKAIVPYMIKNNCGHIIVTSSVTGKYGYFYRSGYAASKHALHGYYESLRFELRKNNINITFIISGPVNSNMSINALVGDGSSHGKKDRMINKGIDPNKLAKKILASTVKNKEEVYFGGKEVTSIYVKRLIPRFWTKIMLKYDHKKELK